MTDKSAKGFGGKRGHVEMSVEIEYNENVKNGCVYFSILSESFVRF